MSRHDGVSCDSCLKGNFRGRRYKCLICFDYDLCATCYEAGVTNTRHSSDHPIQCIITRNDFELYFGGEVPNPEQTQSYTCPFCGRMGHTEATLQEHVTSEHPDSSTAVVCPVCASLPGGEANHVTDDFVAHLTLEHRVPRDFEEPIRHVRRIPHPGRGIVGNRARRSNMHFQPATSGSGLPVMSPSSREASMDPIAELLSQLSSVRSRAVAAQTVSTQLQQLEMQLQSTRQQLERTTRRQADLARATATTTTTAMTYAGAVASSAPLANAQTTVVARASPAPQNPAQQLLLSKLSDSDCSELDKQSAETVRANRSLFMQELLLSSLADTLPDLRPTSSTERPSEPPTPVKIASPTTLEPPPPQPAGPRVPPKINKQFELRQLQGAAFNKRK